MSNTVQVRRGAVGDLPTLAQGSFGYCTDTDQVFIGDGATNHELLVLGVPMSENATICLDQILSADTKWTGITEAGTAGTNGLVYGYCYYKASTAKWEKTNASAASTAKNKLGVCVGAASANGTGTLLVYGRIRADNEFPSFTTGGPVFLSAATAGILTSTAPTGTTNFVVRIVGSADNQNTLFFNPDNSYGELS